MLALLFNAVFWIDGGLSIGSFDTIITINTLMEFYWLALYHYLTRVSSQALKKFRPLLGVDDSEVARIDNELRILPRWLGLIAIPVGLGFAIAMYFGDNAPFGTIITRTPLPYVVDAAGTSFLVATFYCLVIRSIRQLYMVSRLHAQVTNVNLQKLDPAHAFSTLTARTGIGLILLLIFIYILEPASLDTTPIEVFFVSVIVLLSIAVFILPVIGIRDQLEAEKRRLLNQTSDLLQVANDSFHSKINSRDYKDLGGMEIAIRTLNHELELIGKISTWPWDLETFRGFISAVLLPIFLWLITQLLERLL